MYKACLAYFLHTALGLDHESLPPEKVLCCLETSACGSFPLSERSAFYKLWKHPLAGRPLPGATDFPILVLLASSETQCHTRALEPISNDSIEIERSKIHSSPPFS